MSAAPIREVISLHSLQLPWKTYIAKGLLDEQFYRQWYNRDATMKAALVNTAHLRKGDRTVIFETQAMRPTVCGA